MIAPDLNICVDRHGGVTRRGFLRRAALAGAAGGLGLRERLAARASELRGRGTSVILLFMKGGVSQYESFDPKPNTEHGGPTKAIDTDTPGVKVCEYWPNMSRRMRDVAIIRSMTGREANHQRAQFLTHTGYAPSGSVAYPNMGSIVASEISPHDFDLPSFCCINGTTATGSGFLSKAYSPFHTGDPNLPPVNTALPRGVSAEVLHRRLKLMDRLASDFANEGAGPLVEAHRQLVDTASKMMLSSRMEAFDLSRESDALRDRYGRHGFGQGCLLARRLVEAGVTFVEVELFNWDSHRDIYKLHPPLCQAADESWATLLVDLKDRGLLDKTLVVWMGEFGRTPIINTKGGRDHYPRAYSVALAGAGVRGGLVLGRTDDKGVDVVDRPVTINDLFCSIYHAVGIDPSVENDANGRPIKVQDKGEPVLELFDS